jgi:hypothetical protein
VFIELIPQQKIQKIGRFLLLLLDGGTNYYPNCGSCLIVRSINVYTVAYPALVAFVFTLVVSVYASKAIHNLNSVQPVVQLPTISKKVTSKTKDDTDTEQNEEETSDNS